MYFSGLPLRSRVTKRVSSNRNGVQQLGGRRSPPTTGKCVSAIFEPPSVLATTVAQSEPVASMEEIVRRKQVETMISEAKAALQLREFTRCVSVCEEALQVKGVGKLSEEVRKVREIAEPMLRAQERAMQKAANKIKAKLAAKHQMSIDDACAVLSVSREGLERSQLDKAYKLQSLRKHPDRNRNDPDATRKFQRVNAAYERLKLIALSTYDPTPAIAAFKAKLADAGVPSRYSFADVQRHFGDDPTFLAVRTQGERKQAFAEYRTKQESHERESRRLESIQLRANFRAFLSEFKAITPETPWETVTQLLVREPRYKALPEGERADCFADWVHEQTAAKRNAKRDSISRRRRDEDRDRRSRRRRRSHDDEGEASRRHRSHRRRREVDEDDPSPFRRLRD